MSTSSLAGMLAKQHLSERCDLVNKYLSDLLNRKADLKEFYEFFPTLLLKLFGFDDSKRYVEMVMFTDLR